MSATSIPSACRIVNIDSNDAMILPYDANPSRMEFSQKTSRHPARCLVKARLLQVDGLIMPGLVELGTPHLVHTLVIGSAEGHGRAEPKVEIVKIFQGSY
jgi:hypothetical protein